VNRQVLDELKQRIPLLEYLQTQDWQPARALSRSRWMGLCPLHTDHKPSFLVDPNKALFYCYGCGHGGDVIRFAELYHQVNFPQAVTLLRQWCGLAPLLNAVIDFYRVQLQRYNEAVVYLDQRGIRSSEVIEHMRIGYAPGCGLRSWLTQLGYPLSVLRQAGLITAAGYDSYIRCIIFPLETNLYGRCIRSSALPHRFMSGSKGGLYLWEQVRRCPEVILVEGLFDYAVLWQAGFRNLTCSLGNHLNAHQFQQLCDGLRTVYLVFNADANGSGPRASESLSRRLWAQAITVRRVALPEGHDPNRFFVQGGDAHQFQSLLEIARP
jgi:DNA primase